MGGIFPGFTATSAPVTGCPRGYVGVTTAVARIAAHPPCPSSWQGWADFVANVSEVERRDGAAGFLSLHGSLDRLQQPSHLQRNIRRNTGRGPLVFANHGGWRQSIRVVES